MTRCSSFTVSQSIAYGGMRHDQIRKRQRPQPQSDSHRPQRGDGLRLRVSSGRPEETADRFHGAQRRLRAGARRQRQRQPGPGKILAGGCFLRYLGYQDGRTVRQRGDRPPGPLLLPPRRTHPRRRQGGQNNRGSVRGNPTRHTVPAAPRRRLHGT